MIKHKQGTPDYFHRTWEQCGNQSRGGCQNVAHQSCGVQWHRSDTERASNMTLFEPELTWRALWRTLAELHWRDEMDIWTADVWRDIDACWWHLTCLLWIKATHRGRHAGWIVMTGLRRHVDSELVFLQVFDTRAKSGTWTAAPALFWP